MADLQAMIREVRRELALRDNIYPKQVARGSIHPAAAAAQIQCMRSVLYTLERLHQSAAGIAAAPSQGPQR